MTMDLQVALRFAAALGLGVLLELERQRSYSRDEAFGGVRTFALIHGAAAGGRGCRGVSGRISIGNAGNKERKEKRHGFPGSFLSFFSGHQTVAVCGGAVP